MRISRSEIQILFTSIILLISITLWAASKTEESSGEYAAKEAYTYSIRDETLVYIEDSIGPWHVFLTVPRTSSLAMTRTQIHCRPDSMERSYTLYNSTDDSLGHRSSVLDPSPSSESEVMTEEWPDTSNSGSLDSPL